MHLITGGSTIRVFLNTFFMKSRVLQFPAEPDQTHALWVEPRLPGTAGRGKRSSGVVPVFRFVEVLWCILSGL